MDNFFFLFGTNAVFVVTFFCSVGFIAGIRGNGDSSMRKVIIRSRLFMGAAALAVALQVVWHKSVLGDSEDMFRLQGMSIIFTYIISRLLAFGLSPSFDRYFITFKRVFFTVLRIALMGVLLGVINFVALPELTRGSLLTLASGWFAIDTAFIIGYIYYSSLKTCKAYDAFYSEDYNIYLRWVPRFYALMQFYCIAWLPIYYTSNLVQSIYALIGAALWFYLYVCYERYSLYFRLHTTAEIAEIPEDEAPVIVDATYPLPVQEKIPTMEMKDRYEYFVEALAVWIENKGYRQADITIEQLARQFGTNRTYLSSFINSHYGMPFRLWIASLRAEDAKALLLDTYLSEGKIAETLGYPSVQSFVRSFTQATSMSPSDYRKKVVSN